MFIGHPHGMSATSSRVGSTIFAASRERLLPLAGQLSSPRHLWLPLKMVTNLVQDVFAFNFFRPELAFFVLQAEGGYPELKVPGWKRIQHV